MTNWLLCSVLLIILSSTGTWAWQGLNLRKIDISTKKPQDENWIQWCPSSECAELAAPMTITNKTVMFESQRNAATVAEHRAKLLVGCGQICDVSQVTTNSHQVLTKAVDCPALFSNRDADAAASTWPPPEAPPPEFYQDFSMVSAVVLKTLYFAQRTSGNAGAGGNPEAAGWTTAGIDAMVSQAKSGTLAGGYGHKETPDIQGLIMKHAQEFSGKRILVVGSMTPWLEAILLAAGVGHVTTVEYGELPKQPHPQVTTMTPTELASKFLSGSLQLFDGAASYSSIEHSGLGRYGDTVNPWGDLQATAKVWCVLKPEAVFLMGVPDGTDEIEWNAHRRYGPRRWPHLMANYVHIESTPHLGLYKQIAALYRKSIG